MFFILLGFDNSIWKVISLGINIICMNYLRLLIVKRTEFMSSIWLFVYGIAWTYPFLRLMLLVIESWYFLDYNAIKVSRTIWTINFIRTGIRTSIWTHEHKLLRFLWSTYQTVVWISEKWNAFPLLLIFTCLVVVCIIQ